MANLNISKRVENGTAILDLKGHLIYGDETFSLRQSIRDLIRDGNRRINLNLEELEYLDSSGIGELISALTAVNREDGQLKLLNPPDKAHRLLAISSLLDIFEIEFEERAAGN